jgi:hypothetical protein
MVCQKETTMLRKILSVFVSVLLLSSVSGVVLVSAQESGDSKDSNKKTLEQTGLTPQPYNADTRFKVGTVIQPDEKESSKVVAATKDKVDRAFGVVVSTNNLPITISSNTAASQVFVATNGRQDAMVTSENGSINVGDSLAVSSLSGTLMKATYKERILFGKALASFDGKNNTIGTTTLKDDKGNAHQQIGIGVIPISIEIMKNPEDKSTKANLPQQLQRLGQLIAEKPVSPIRIYLSMAIVTITIIIALVLLYAGVRSAIISIGRNPLSKKSILRGLLQVILTSVLVLIIGLFTVYLLLRL